MKLTPGFCWILCSAICAIALLAASSPGDEVPTTAPASTRPAELPADVDAAIRQTDAADASVIPTIMLWLGSEQDDLRVGKGSARFRACFHAVEKFRIKLAVPWLVALCDNPTAQPWLRNAAAEAAIHADPYYSMEFLRDVLDDESLTYRSPELLAAGQRAAAAALAVAGDDHARDLLLQAFRQYLDSLSAGGASTGDAAVNHQCCLEIAKLSDSVLFGRIASLQPQYAKEPARTMLQGMLRQMSTNLLSQAELFGLAEDADPKHRNKRICAILSLGHNAGPEALDRLHAIEQSLSASEPATQPATQPTTQPAEIIAAATSQPATQPSNLAGEQSVLALCKKAISEIESRSLVPVSDASRKPASTQPTEIPGEQTVGDDAELVEPDEFLRKQVNGTQAIFFIVYDLPGILPRQEVLVRDHELLNALLGIPYGTLARLKLSEEGSELQAIRLVRTAPGEASHDGYVFSELRTLKEGQWEHTALVLHKFGRETLARIPNRHRSNGQWTPDSRMMGVASKLTPGQCVLAHVDADNGLALLTSLAPYRPSMPAELLRVTTIARDGQSQPAIELMIARKRKVFALPDENSAYPTLDADTLRSLPPEAALRVILDDDSHPQSLLGVRLDTDHSVRAGGRQIAFRAGRLIFLGRSDNDYLGTFELYRRHEVVFRRLFTGISRFIAANPNLPEATAAALKEAQARSILQLQPADHIALQAAIRQWMKAGPADRIDIERDIDNRLLKASAQQTQREDGFRERVRSLLTPGEYEAVLAAGRPAMAMPASTQPAVAP